MQESTDSRTKIEVRGRQPKLSYDNSLRPQIHSVNILPLPKAGARPRITGGVDERRFSEKAGCDD